MDGGARVQGLEMSSCPRSRSRPLFRPWFSTGSTWPHLETFWLSQLEGYWPLLGRDGLLLNTPQCTETALPPHTQQRII